MHTLTHQLADSTTAFTNYVDNEDKDLQQALAASMEDSGLPPQQSGVLDQEVNPYFGPATRDDYGDNWAMVPISTVKEIYDDPEPTDRIRDTINQVPAFLKPSSEEHRLGALLTILYNIPLVREILLRRDKIETYYPYEAGWWSGRPIEKPIASFQEDPYLVAADRRFGQEVQKVMAFLEKTDRSYGSADVITALPYLGMIQSDDVEASFFMGFHRILQNNELFEHIYSTGCSGSGPDPDFEPTPFVIFDVRFPPKDSLCQNLYDITDQTLWGTYPLDPEQSLYLSHIGDIMAFRIKVDNQNDQKGIEVPLVWYPDRYLEFAVKDSLTMRTKKSHLEKKIAEISHKERQLTWTIHNGKSLLVEDVFKTSLKHDQNEITTSNRDMDNLDSDTSMGGSRSKDLSGMLRDTMDAVNAKLKSKDIQVNPGLRS